jgi:hypothetical protein
MSSSGAPLPARFIGPAIRAQAAKDDMVLADRDTGLGFKGGKCRTLDYARHRDELIAGGAVQMVVMRRDQLETGTAVVEHYLAERPIRHQLFGGAKDRGEIPARAALCEGALEVF